MTNQKLVDRIAQLETALRLARATLETVDFCVDGASPAILDARNRALCVEEVRETLDALAALRPGDGWGTCDGPCGHDSARGTWADGVFWCDVCTAEDVAADARESH